MKKTQTGIKSVCAVGAFEGEQGRPGDPAWVQVGMVVVINDHVGSDGGDCGDADDDDDYDGVQWWPGDATWVQVRVMMVKYEFVDGVCWGWCWW